MRTSVQFLFLGLLAAVCSFKPATSGQPPSGWIRIDVHNFAFFVPPDVRLPSHRVIDVFRGDLRGNSVALNYQYDKSTDDLARFQKARGYASHEELIDGKRVRITSFHYELSPDRSLQESIAVQFLEPDAAGFYLSLAAMCKTTNDYATVQTIFRTISRR